MLQQNWVIVCICDMVMQRLGDRFDLKPFHSDVMSLGKLFPHVGPGCVLCPRIDPLHFLAGCRRRRLSQDLVVALDFLSLLDRACFCVIFFGLWVHALFSSLSFCYQYQCN